MVVQLDGVGSPQIELKFAAASIVNAAIELT